MFIFHKGDLEGHEWRVMEHCNNTAVLLQKKDQYFIQSNICPHQGSKIRSEWGNGLPVCPYHGWSWDEDGNPRGHGTVGMGPGSEQCKNTHELAMAPTHEWNGFLFSGQIPVDVDISGRYYLHEYRKDIVQSSHVNIMDLFLDIDHIPVVHKNVYEPIGIRSFDKIRWQSWNGGSVQMVDREDGKLGALWLAVYPNTMLEWQPGAVFVMVNEVIDHRTTRSHVFQYRDADSSDSQWQLNSEIWEEAWAQDRAQAELLEPGWRITPEENLDREKRAFRAWLKDNPGT